MTDHIAPVGPMTNAPLAETLFTMSPDSPNSQIPSDSEDEEDQIDDDGGLTIRIPNPRFYLARQTQWKGRRGKPRCDNCRTNNLKVRHLFLYIMTRLNHDIVR
jgi:hypothetical protein